MGLFLTSFCDPIYIHLHSLFQKMVKQGTWAATAQVDLKWVRKRVKPNQFSVSFRSIWNMDWFGCHVPMHLYLSQQQTRNSAGSKAAVVTLAVSFGVLFYLNSQF